MGGQAVMDGVMMRGESVWAVAVRREDGGIELRTGDAPHWAERYGNIPLVRGVVNLVESLSLGMRALTWSADVNAPEDEQLSKGSVIVSLGMALVFFVGVFLLLPMLGARGASSLLGLSGAAFHLLEGLFSLGLFLGYITLIGRIPDINRVFQYHGAEHKAIAAYERGVELTPESAQQFTTEHVRCGTNFLLTVFVIAIVVYSMVGRPALPILVLSRVLLIPVIAGLAYEVIRFAAGHMDKRWVRTLMVPGLALQRLTTREPSLDQLEVAIASLRAVFTDAQTAEVDGRRAA
jgi:uncharacterized protein YqhQ